MYLRDLSWSDLSPSTQRRNPGLREILGGGTDDEKDESKKCKSKYHSKKVLLDGIIFDSKKEVKRYAELLLALRGRVIIKLELQPRFLLMEGYRDKKSGKWVRKMEYVADFRITYPNGHQVVIDTKGYRTRVYQNKLKLFRKKYPDIDFREE